jgi:hypothetical protein
MLHTELQPLISRVCLVGSDRQGSANWSKAARPRRWPGLAPLVVLPAVVLALHASLPAWLSMWAMLVAVFAGCKWLTWWDAPIEARHSSRGRSLGYLFAWPGMDAAAFLKSNQNVSRPRAVEWTAAALKTLLGIALICGVAPLFPIEHPLVVGWTGMIGLAFLLHFGVFHLLALVWQQVGVDARHIFRSPALATSVGDFWGSRWNMAFRELSYSYVFRPLVSRFGMVGASLVAFLASGLVHELVISVPAGAGFGLPTIYFLIQWLGVQVERSSLGKRLRLRSGLSGWLFALVVTVGPAGLLFHPPFVIRVMVPFMHSIGVCPSCW